MERQPWLERVAETLAGEGLPAHARARLLAELRDHLEDLTEGGNSMATEAMLGERMGNPEALAACAGAEFRRTGWVRRHPVLVFGVAPVPAVALGVVLYVLLVAGVGYAARTAGFEDSSLPRGLVTGCVYGLGFIPFMATAALLGWMASRSGVGRGWQVLAVAQVAALAGLATVQLTLSDLAGQSQLMIGLTFPLTGWRQGLQLVLPLAIGWMTVRSASRQTAMV